MKQPLLPVEDAQQRLLAMVDPLPVVDVPVEEALGRWLAAPLLARRTQPAADLSAMDGYALATGDPDGPWQVIGESAAGHPFAGEVAVGTAVRISTGALLPRGAASVLLQEDTSRKGDSLTLSGDAPVEGRHIRRAGFDFREGDPLLPAGTRITPGTVALALSAGHRDVAVRVLPRVAIIDSGDELSAAAGPLPDHHIPASNGAMLAAMARGPGAETLRLGPIPDRFDALLDAFDLAADADIIVTSGGASVGEHDLVRPALEQWGAEIAFWKVAMKPGKPIMVARKGRQLILGLPGNPVSSFVTAYLFMLPLIRALGGAEACLPRPVQANAGSDIAAGGGRAEYLRAHWDGASATPLREQDSSALRTLARSNALIHRPIDAPAVAAGGAVTIFLLENGGIA